MTIMNKAIAIFSIIFSVIFSGFATAQQEADAQAPLPEEITVTGERNLYILEEQMRDAQLAVYDIYNDLNTDDTYDIHCDWEEPLGTNIRHWVCRPGFIEEATYARGQDFMGQLMGFAAAVTLNPELENTRHMPILIEKMQSIVDESPELESAMRRHIELMQAYNQRVTEGN